MKTDLKVGDTVRYSLGAGDPLTGKLTSITPGKSYNGPKTGPYRVAPKAILVYAVQLPDNSVARYVHTEGLACPLTVVTDA